MEKPDNIPPEFDEIERFLQRQMPQEEEMAFRGRMQENPALQAAVDEWRLIITGIEESALQERLDSFHDKTGNAKIKRFSVNRWLAAASILVVIALAVWWYTGKPQHEQLFAQYFIPDSGLMTSMGSSDDYTFNRAMVDYKSGKYNESIVSWKSLQSLTKNDTLDYFIGAGYIALNNPDSAIIYFKQVIDDKQTVFFDDANWYLGLSLLKQNKISEAIPYIQRSNHPDKNALLSKLTP